jgi:hypothetical protein
MAQRSFTQKHCSRKKGNSVWQIIYKPTLRELVFLKDEKPYLPCFVVKKKPTLISLSSIDFPLLWKKHHKFFALFHQFKIKVNLQNSV